MLFLRKFMRCTGNRDQCRMKGSGLWDVKRPLVVEGKSATNMDLQHPRSTITDFKDDSEFVTFLKGQTSFEDFEEDYQSKQKRSSVTRPPTTPNSTSNKVTPLFCHNDTPPDAIAPLHEGNPLSKSHLVVEAVRQVHAASLAAGMPFDKPRQTINNIAVLYAQAVKLNSHFQGKVQHWASQCNGLAAGSLPVKRRKRAIQKLWRTYRGDAARLIDFCRSSIEIKDPEGLVKCLEVILSDPECAVLQIKNRLTEKHDSSTTAGYRNVSLSLIIVNHFTMIQGVDCHVCELQLGLSSFEYLKHFLDGHKRYVQFRDARAE